MQPRIEHGWLMVPIDTSLDMAETHMGVGKTEADVDWRPAFRDWDTNGQRVAKIRPPATGLPVWIRINGEVTKLRTV